MKEYRLPVFDDHKFVIIGVCARMVFDYIFYLVNFLYIGFCGLLCIF